MSLRTMFYMFSAPTYNSFFVMTNFMHLGCCMNSAMKSVLKLTCSEVLLTALGTN